MEIYRMTFDVSNLLFTADFSAQGIGFFLCAGFDEGASRLYRALGKFAKADLAVIHGDGGGDADIDAEFHRDFDDMVAFVLYFLREMPHFRTEHISGAQGVAKAGEIYGLIGEFNTDQLAFHW